MCNIIVKTESRGKCKKTKRLLNSFQIETELLRQFTPANLYIRLLTNHDVTHQEPMHQEECDSATIPKKGRAVEENDKKASSTKTSKWFYG